MTEHLFCCYFLSVSLEIKYSMCRPIVDIKWKIQHVTCWFEPLPFFHQISFVRVEPVHPKQDIKIHLAICEFIILFWNHSHSRLRSYRRLRCRVLIFIFSDSKWFSVEQLLETSSHFFILTLIDGNYSLKLFLNRYSSDNKNSFTRKVFILKRNMTLHRNSSLYQIFIR